MSKKKGVGRNRSAITGQYVTLGEAQKEPNHTVHETDKPTTPKPAPKPAPKPKATTRIKPALKSTPGPKKRKKNSSS